MSSKYKQPCDVPDHVLLDRLRELSKAISNRDMAEFTMRVPAEYDRDADLVLLEVARRMNLRPARIVNTSKESSVE